MSSFSSVVRKSGTNFKPKISARRNISRRTTSSTNLAVPDHQPASQYDESGATPPDAGAGHLERSQSVQGLEKAPVLATDAQTPPPTAASTEKAILPQLRSKRLAKAALRSDSATRETQSQAQELTVGDTHIDRDIIDAGGSSIVEDNQAQPTRVDEFPHPTTQSAANSDRSLPAGARSTQSIEQASIRRPASSEQIRLLVSLPQDTNLSAPSIHAQSVSRRDSIQSQSSNELLESATKQAANVSSLANDIETRTRAYNLRRNPVPAITEDVRSQDSVGSERRRDRSKSNKRKRKTAAEQAAEVVANAIRGTDDAHVNGQETPENAEDYQLAPDEVTMGELIIDRKLGKKSQLEQDMERDWEEIVKRRKEARDLALENALKGRRRAFGNSTEAPLQATVAIGPRTEIRNGKIVVIEESRQIDRNGALEQAAVLDAENVREDKLYYKRVNQNTVGVKAYASRKFRWNEESTEQFFKGLRMFGTDFLMIANLFPGLDRKQIKTKFIREENADKPKVMEALANRLPIDLEEYSKVADLTLQDPVSLQAEIDAEEQRLKDEDHQRRIREGFVSANDPGSGPQNEATDSRTEVDGTSENVSRFAALAEEIMSPKKRQRKAGPASKKRGPKAGRRPAEGIEEVLGSIDEVRV